MISKKNLMILFLMQIAFGTVYAQKSERDYLRKGNKLYRDSTFVDAEVNYRKALEANPSSATSMYNLGNSLLFQNKPKEAIEQYAAVAKIEKDKGKLAMDLHNVGVIWHTQKEYERAIEAYKEALRKNPKDDETRYNLALAQKMLKDQQNQNQNQEQKEQQQQQEQQQEQEQEQQNQPQQDDNQMSKENAEQLLNSVMQDEKNVQEKVKKQQTIKGRKLEKDW